LSALVGTIKCLMLLMHGTTMKIVNAEQQSYVIPTRTPD